MVVRLFDAVAAGYDEPRRRLVPCFDDFYGTAVAATAAVLREVEAPRVLDLGAGTGLLAGLIARAVPDTDLTLVDAAPAMLAVAERRLTGVTHRVHVANLTDPLPGDGYHAIVSALTIHHLDPAPVEAQCDWLRTAGFVDVDCFYKSWRFAVFGGRV